MAEGTHYGNAVLDASTNRSEPSTESATTDDAEGTRRVAPCSPLPRRRRTALRRLQTLDLRTQALRASHVTDLHRQSAAEVLHRQTVRLRGGEWREDLVGVAWAMLV